MTNPATQPPALTAHTLTGQTISARLRQAGFRRSAARAGRGGSAFVGVTGYDLIKREDRNRREWRIRPWLAERDYPKADAITAAMVAALLPLGDIEGVAVRVTDALGEVTITARLGG
jgi:hypothetical protein